MNPLVVIVDDEPRYRELYAQVLERNGVRVRQAANAEEALSCIESLAPDLVISDVRMPGRSGIELLELARRRFEHLPFLLVTAHADVRDAVAALKLGAVDYLAKPVDLHELTVCVVETLGITQHRDQEDPPANALAGIVAQSPAMRELMRQAWLIARSDVSALLMGESGTGKEELARFLHRNSPRKDGPFVVVNCSALPASLVESELFGHERGAFDGASEAREGHFRQARGGVLFLDEIGDLPLQFQPLLLRAIERRAVTPLGGSQELDVDFRLIAATHRSLEADVAAGRFRADLYYRLNVITLGVPPLRERSADVLTLAWRFLGESSSGGQRLSRAAKLRLTAHDWPGNVRELRNAMKRAQLLSRSDVVLPEHLPPTLRALPAAGAGRTSPERAEGPVRTLRESEVSEIRAALAATDGNRTKAAELLGISRRGLLKKLKRFELE